MLDEQDRTLKAAIHERWVASLNRDMGAPGYRDEWRAEQCLHCRFFVPLAGDLGADWGGCTNSVSNFDRRVMFEHDGCERFQLEKGK
jgi:Protein of unknown function (DUF3027)